MLKRKAVAVGLSMFLVLGSTAAEAQPMGPFMQWIHMLITHVQANYHGKGGLGHCR